MGVWEVSIPFLPFHQVKKEINDAILPLPRFNLSNKIPPASAFQPTGMWLILPVRAFPMIAPRKPIIFFNEGYSGLTASEIDGSRLDEVR